MSVSVCLRGSDVLLDPFNMTWLDCEYLECCWVGGRYVIGDFQVRDGAIKNPACGGAKY